MGRLGVLGAGLIVLCVLLGLPQNAAAESFIRGDVNSDGRVSIADLVFIVHSQLLEGREPDCEDAADVDDNGELTLLDTLYLLTTLFGPGPTAIPVWSCPLNQRARLFGFVIPSSETHSSSLRWPRRTSD